jgi:hypothetical protein
MNKIIAFSAILIFILLLACKESDKEDPCTMEFRTVGITVSGDSLTKYYTVRTSTKDTIINSSGFSILSNYYVVLDDNYLSKIKNSQDYFNFYGFINDTLVVNEVFLIKADHCHIEKLSGKSELNISH